MKTRLTYTWLSLAVVLAGCSGPMETANMAARKWFSISIDADNAVLKPNQQIELEVTWTAVFATPDAELSVVLPEVEAAKLSGWGDDFMISIGVTLPPILEFDSAFAKGGEVKRTVEVTIPAAGIYTVVASGRSTLQQTPEVPYAQWTVHESIWLLIDENGGRVIEDFDYRTQPGPFRGSAPYRVP